MSCPETCLVHPRCHHHYLLILRTRSVNLFRRGSTAAFHSLRSSSCSGFKRLSGDLLLMWSLNYCCRADRTGALNPHHYRLLGRVERSRVCFVSWCYTVRTSATLQQYCCVHLYRDFRPVRTVLCTAKYLAQHCSACAPFERPPVTVPCMSWYECMMKILISQK